MTTKVLKDWQAWCTKLQQARGAYKQSPTDEYRQAVRFAVRKCTQLERRM